MWESESSSSQFKEAFLILQNEHNYQMQQYPELEIPSFSSMQANAFNQSTLAAYADFIEELTAIFNQDFQLSHNRLSKKRDHFINTQKETYYGLRNKYHNEAVSDIVCQFYEKNKILTSNNRLVQHVDAIYNDPIIDSQFDIRSHLFAPNKHFMGRLYATFPFNMSIIWLMNLLLFIILRTNIIRKIINFKVN
jgi:hypothetical protein